MAGDGVEHIIDDLGGEKCEDPDWIETEAVPDINDGFEAHLKKHSDFEDFMRDRDKGLG